MTWLVFHQQLDDFNEIPKLLSFCIQTGRSSPDFSLFVGECGTFIHLADSNKTYHELSMSFCGETFVIIYFSSCCSFLLSAFEVLRFLWPYSGAYQGLYHSQNRKIKSLVLVISATNCIARLPHLFSQSSTNKTLHSRSIFGMCTMHNIILDPAFII